jgi:hypothetical protein
VLTSP